VQIPKRTYTLVFQGAPGDEDLDGVVVKVRPPTVLEALENIDIGWLRDGSLPPVEHAKRLADLYAVFASRLVEWNLEDAGQPIPATLDGLHQIPHDVGGRILGSWLYETSTVPAPLPQDSPTGSDSVDESEIPMTAAAPSGPLS
jgi:hypothetical protein